MLSSAARHPQPTATTPAIEFQRLQAREQLLAHKIKVQTTRNDINATESLLSHQSSKLAQARKVHEELCFVEKEQARLLSSLRQTKEELLRRAAKVCAHLNILASDLFLSSLLTMPCSTCVSFVLLRHLSTG
jgi:hypothetical protein